VHSRVISANAGRGDDDAILYVIRPTFFSNSY
jgi:hypothetical protein